MIVLVLGFLISVEIGVMTALSLGIMSVELLVLEPEASAFDAESD